MAECLQITRERQNEHVYTGELLQKILPYYYDKLFPYHILYKWLSYGTSSHFFKREISLTLQSGAHIRYACFPSEDLFLDYIRRKNPSKIDIGSVYNVPPRDAKFISHFKSVEKELVFDIDMSDYDEVRTCCKEANVCNSCWKYLVIACKILDRILREDFGFEHLLWVFSGRRGVHCWVCDQKARTLSNEERNYILSYMVLIQGGIGVRRRVKLPVKPIHTSIKRALKIIEEIFVDFIIKEQNILGTANGIKKFLDLLKDCPQNHFKNVICCDTSESAWNAFVNYIDDPKQQSSFPASLKYLKEEIILHHLYPRLDGNVTKRMDHLLKAPFSVHPVTGKLSIPIDLNKIAEFDVNNVPTVHSVLTELNVYFEELVRSGQKIQDDVKENLKHTSLCEPIQILEKVVTAMEICNKVKNTRKF